MEWMMLSFLDPTVFKFLRNLRRINLRSEKLVFNIGRDDPL